MNVLFWLQVAILVIFSVFALGCFMALLAEIWPRNPCKDADHRARMRRMAPP